MPSSGMKVYVQEEHCMHNKYFFQKKSNRSSLSLSHLSLESKLETQGLDALLRPSWGPEEKNKAIGGN